MNKLFETEHLTCFEFGNSYLMLELDNEYDVIQEESKRIKTYLRMNVPSVKKLANKLASKDVKVDYQEHEWVTVAKFFDPDENLCAFKDSKTFEKQIMSSYKLKKI